MNNLLYLLSMFLLLIATFQQEIKNAESNKDYMISYTIPEKEGEYVAAYFKFHI